MSGILNAKQIVERALRGDRNFHIAFAPRFPRSGDFLIGGGSDNGETHQASPRKFALGMWQSPFDGQCLLAANFIVKQNFATSKLYSDDCGELGTLLLAKSHMKPL